MAQSPSRINAIKAPERTKQRRNWILSRMLKLRMINKSQFDNAAESSLVVSRNVDLYDVDGKFLAELARQEIISRYGLMAYKNGWSIFTTMDSTSQKNATTKVITQLAEYDKRHGWKEAQNFEDIFTQEQLNNLAELNIDFISDEMLELSSFDDETKLSNRINIIFEDFPFYKTHSKGIVINLSNNSLYFINEDLEIDSIPWSSEYEWARKRISIDERGPKPNSFKDFLNIGDFVYFKKEVNYLLLDQIPDAESALISMHPTSGAVRAYIGGTSFNKSNFDRVRLSYPQSGSSFKPFIYATALADEYNASSLINDAPIAFEDKNLESIWRPQNYTGKFYGPTSIRDALIRSINIVSIKLLREMGISKSHDFIQNFGFEKSRLPSDLSLALGSGNFSPAEMVRAFSVIANGGYLVDPYFISKIEDRDGNVIYSHNDYINLNDSAEIKAFPWLNTLEMNIKKPYFLINPKLQKDPVIDERIAFLIKDILQEFMQKGTAGRKSSFLNRDDIAGKTGTTNDAVSTWFSGFHEDLVTTVWVGTDDFSSLGENEYGSTIALPIWLDYMNEELNTLEIKEKNIPEGLSFIRVNKKTGKIDDLENKNTYFELFLDENIED